MIYIRATPPQEEIVLKIGPSQASRHEIDLAIADLEIALEEAFGAGVFGEMESSLISIDFILSGSLSGSHSPPDPEAYRLAIRHFIDLRLAELMIEIPEPTPITSSSNPNEVRFDESHLVSRCQAFLVSRIGLNVNRHGRPRSITDHISDDSISTLKGAGGEETSAASDTLPIWDPVDLLLSYGPSWHKQYMKNASRQIPLLNRFHGAGWPRHLEIAQVQDTLHVAAERHLENVQLQGTLGSTVRDLNKSLGPDAPIVFSMDRSRRGVRWCPVTPSPLSGANALTPDEATSNNGE